uniref:Replication-associated protein n=1 Tax=Plasmid pSB24.2 TaxID=2623 RepID=Q52205_9ZZZZ|nr:replication-associated protein [Plasmid pSB24.2]
MDPDAGVIFARTAAGAAVALGLLKCGRIWLCPVCSGQDPARPSEEITEAVVSWLQQGGWAYLVTFTARHTAADRLSDLMDALQGTRADAETGTKRRPGAYQRLITGAAWAGDKRRKSNQEGIRGRIGYIGMIRATEVTVGEGAGWHPHIHAIVLVGGRTEGQRGDKRITGTFTPSEDALTEWEDRWRRSGPATLARSTPGFRPPTGARSPGATAGARATASTSSSSVRSGRQRPGRVHRQDAGRQEPGPGAGTRRPQGRPPGQHDVLRTPSRIGDLMGGVPEEEAAGHGSLAWGLDRWAEYETAVSGAGHRVDPLPAPAPGPDRRRHRGRRHGRPVPDRRRRRFRDGVQIWDRAWNGLVGRSLDLAVVEAVEGREISMDALGELVQSAGQSRAFLRVLTPQEVTELYDELLGTLARRREQAAERRAAEAAEAEPTTR